MAQAPSSKKVAHGLVAAGAAAVLAVYAAGYTRTRSAADQLDAQSAERRPPSIPAAATAKPPSITDSAQDEPVAAAPVAATEQSQPVSASSSPAPKATKTFEPPAPSASENKEIAVAVPVAPSAASIPAPAAPPLSAPVVVASSLPPAASMTPPAPAPAAAPAPTPAAAPAPKWKDGTYTGWGSCRHGDIQAQVVIENGRIQGASIAQCLTRYSCSVIGRLPPEVAERQSAEVDYVSGATQSANAFYYAVLDALAKAK